MAVLTSPCPVLSPDAIDHFITYGFVPVPGAFSADAAVKMQAFLWRRLQRHGIQREDPRTWTADILKLNDVNRHDVFAAIAGERLRSACDQLVGSGAWRQPASWGNILVSMPHSGAPWQLASTGWHTDVWPRTPTSALLAFTFLSEVQAQGGGTLLAAGSQRLVARYYESLDDRQRQSRRNNHAQQCLDGDPWSRELSAADAALAGRTERFMHADTQSIHGDPLRVVEAVGNPGDAILCHPYMFHARSMNCAQVPRFMRVAILRLAPPLCLPALQPATPLALSLGAASPRQAPA